MLEKKKDIIIIVVLGLLSLLIIIWGVITNNQENPGGSSSSSSHSSSASNSSSNSEDDYDYYDAHSRFEKDKNPEDQSGIITDLDKDPIWNLVSSSNKIVQIDFIITIKYIDNTIHLDTSLSMTPDELLNSDAYLELYKNKVLNYLINNNINPNNYTINYIIPE